MAYNQASLGVDSKSTPWHLLRIKQKPLMIEVCQGVIYSKGDTHGI